MNQAKLAESIEVFKQTYLLDRKTYHREERKWKVRLRDQFQKVFAYDNVIGDSFLSSLKVLFEDSMAAWAITWLCGGAYYQRQRFLGLLQSEPSQTLLSGLFCDLLFSQAAVGDRINRFKREIDALYKGLPRRSTIQLNLISQFLGLCFPDEYYIYKYTEFNQAVSYFEYDVELSDTSTGGKYEYYFGLLREVKSAMYKAGLHDVDFIDVHTFVYRRDWYTPVDLEQEKDKFEEETAKLGSLSVQKLIEHVKKPRSGEPKVTSQVYYYRDPNIAALVKKDAQGICDLCGQEAPFVNRKGKPYLENHHVQYLADGGKDSIANCVALCPSCHAKMHVLNLETDRGKLFATARERYERLL